MPLLGLREITVKETYKQLQIIFEQAKWHLLRFKQIKLLL